MIKICETLTEISKKTWSDLKDSEQLSLRIGEESITDYLLLEIARKHRGNISAIKFNKHEESKYFGADWEWWFVSHKSSFGLRVQAKKLDIKNRNYKGIAKKSGSSRGLQINKLIISAKSHKPYPLYPIYCLYNYWDQYVFSGTLECGDIVHKPDLWGCSIADAKKIKSRQKLGLLGLNDIAPLSVPLSCLLCCNCEDDNYMPYPERVRRKIKKLVGKSRVPKCIEKPPQYVSEIMKYRGEMANTPEKDNIVQSLENGASPGVAGVVVFIDNNHYIQDDEDHVSSWF